MRQCLQCGTDFPVTRAHRKFCKPACADAYRKAHQPPCTIDGCDQPIASKGMCSKHYKRQLEGRPLEPVRQCPNCGATITGHAGRKFCNPECRDAYALANAPKCKVDGCDQPARAVGLCNKHYTRHKLGKPVEADPPPRRGPYKGRNAKFSYEERVAARAAPAPQCKCGCRQLTEFDVSRNRYFRYLPGHYRPTKPYHDADWLRTEYIDKQRTMQDIGDQFGVNATSIKRYLTRFGIPMRTQAESLRLSGATAGANNPAWKGGTTPERQRLYKTYEWRQLVAKVFERDGYACQRCGDKRNARGNRFHAHHIELWSDAPDRRTDPDNLVTLCRACHQWVHSNENTEREFLAR